MQQHTQILPAYAQFHAHFIFVPLFKENRAQYLLVFGWKFCQNALYLHLGFFRQQHPIRRRRLVCGIAL